MIQKILEIISFNSNYTKFLNPKNNKEIENFKNYLQNYGIIKNINNNINIVMVNEKSNPYDYIKNINDDYESSFNYDLYLCIRDIILHYSYEPDLKDIYKNKEIYKDDLSHEDVDNILFFYASMNPYKGTEYNIHFDSENINKYHDIYEKVFGKLNFYEEKVDKKIKEDLFYHEFELILQNQNSLSIFKKCLKNLENNIHYYFKSNEYEMVYKFINKLIEIL